MNLFFWKPSRPRTTRDEAVASVAAATLAPHITPPRSLTTAPLAPNPAVRDMEHALALLVYRAVETLAKSALYFPASDLAVLGVSVDSHDLCRETDRLASSLLLRPDMKHGERYVRYSGEIATALASAERAATLLRLVCTSEHNTAALPLLRRVAESCERVIRQSAKVLDAEPADVFVWSNSVVAAKNETQTAVHKALTLLARRPAMLIKPAENMVRMAIWSMEIAAEGAAHAALECRGVVLPATLPAATDARNPLPHRDAKALPRPSYSALLPV